MTATGGTTIVVQAPLDFIPLHVRGGSILPTQEPAVSTDIRFIFSQRFLITNQFHSSFYLLITLLNFLSYYSLLLFECTCSRTNPMGVVIAPDASDTASGTFFWDDGDSIGMKSHQMLRCNSPAGTDCLNV